MKVNFEDQTGDTKETRSPGGSGPTVRPGGRGLLCVGVSEGKSEQQLHWRGRAQESSASGNQGQCQSQPVP